MFFMIPPLDLWQLRDAEYHFQIPIQPCPKSFTRRRKELRGEVHGREEDAIVAIADATMQPGDVNLERHGNARNKRIDSLGFKMVQHWFNMV